MRLSLKTLLVRAKQVLERNDMGTFTKPAPSLYPHQWSWDSAFIAIGLASYNPLRAAKELRHLFGAQWRDGRVPHIVFSPQAEAGSYLPGPEWWGIDRNRSFAREATSGICQPPVHALAALRIWRAAQRTGNEAAAAAIRILYPRLFAWHRYLATCRDPDDTGLVTIYHPWESGMDNSPRWDTSLASISVDPELPHYDRPDLRHVSDQEERPDKADYDRYLSLVRSLRRAGYDDKHIQSQHPFQMQDVLFTAVTVAANGALAELARALNAPDEHQVALRQWGERGRTGLLSRWDPQCGLALDQDVMSNTPISARTVAGFAPLIATNMPHGIIDAQIRRLDSDWFCAAPDLRWPLPPSTSPSESTYSARRYWRGPIWPVANWLIWEGLRSANRLQRAEQIRQHSLEQINAGGFAEYFEPHSGQPLGSQQQSWTAAVAIDWLHAAFPQSA